MKPVVTDEISNKASCNKPVTSSLKNNAIRLQFKYMLKTQKRKMPECEAFSLIDKADCQIQSKDESGESKLRRKAVDVLTKEARIAAERASVIGVQGWVKPASLNTNKQFLARTLQSVEISRKDDEERLKRARLKK